MNLPADASNDQSNCPPDYYRRNNGMLHQIPDETTPETQGTTITPETLAALDGMTKDALIALIIKMGGVSVALMTKQEQAEAMMHRLAERALDRSGRETLAAINQWLDREKGKAVTPIAAQIVVKDEKPIDKRELARKIDFLMSMAENESEIPLIES